MCFIQLQMRGYTVTQLQIKKHKLINRNINGKEKPITQQQTNIFFSHVHPHMVFNDLMKCWNIFRQNDPTVEDFQSPPLQS